MYKELSRHMNAAYVRLAEMYRREAEYRKTLHGQLANEILAVSKNISTERLSYRAFQKTFDKSVGVRAPGMFISILKRKAESSGGGVYEFNTRTTALSQVCHCGEKHKKPRRQRVHDCMCGTIMQRDLNSAYLARFVKEDVLHATKASLSWLGAESLLRAAWKHSQQLASVRKVPASFGVFRSQSESPEKENLVERKSLDVVACGREPIRAQSIISP